jgi:uncharacterized LabA/DUF88 family protein
MERIIAYIDGFNLYFGLKSKGWRKYYWLNQKLLIENLLTSNQSLITTKYFTARVTMPPDKVKRQSDYLEALGTLSDFNIFYGHYLIDFVECYKCGNMIFKPNEKMTDVNIAVELMKDAYNDNFDKAFLVSADSDLISPVRTIRELFPNKKVIVIFPPGRSSKQLKKFADGYFTIGHGKLAVSQFPNNITKVDGYILERPKEWG